MCGCGKVLLKLNCFLKFVYAFYFVREGAESEFSGGGTYLPLLIRPPSTLWNVTKGRKERKKENDKGKRVNKKELHSF